MASLLHTVRTGVQAPFLLPGVARQLVRNHSSCQCGAVIPPIETVVDLVQKRALGELHKTVPCDHFKSLDFNESSTCALSTKLRDFLFSNLGQMPDVVHANIGNSRVYLEALMPTPSGNLGNLTGDHGKHLTSFIKKCHKRGYLENIGSVVDVGGQNTSTVKQVTKVLGRPMLPSLVLDVNAIVPHLLPIEKNIFYAIDDAENFLRSRHFSQFFEGFRQESSSNLMIFNNFINVLRPEKAWDTLDAVWSRIAPGDYLVIAGLKADYLSKFCIGPHTLDGITEFHFKLDGRFYKTGLTADFPKYVEQALEGSSVVVKEPINYFSEGRRGSQLPVESTGILALRKTA